MILGNSGRRERKQDREGKAKDKRGSSSSLAVRVTVLNPIGPEAV